MKGQLEWAIGRAVHGKSAFPFLKSPSWTLFRNLGIPMSSLNSQTSVPNEQQEHSYHTGGMEQKSGCSSFSTRGCAFQGSSEKPHPTNGFLLKFYPPRLPSCPEAETLAWLLKALCGFSFIPLIFSVNSESTHQQSSSSKGFC